MKNQGKIKLTLKKAYVYHIIIFAFVLFTSMPIFSQPPPPPGGGGTGTGGNTGGNQTGGSAPIGGGSLILLGLAAVYGGKKAYSNYKNNLED